MTEPATPAPVIEGPATLAGVAAWLDQLADDEATPAPRPQLDLAVTATNVWVRRMRGVSLTDATLPWDADVVLGATMLAGRLWRRRDSPAGVETFGGDGAVYVQRRDADVDLLLQLGAYAPPRVG